MRRQQPDLTRLAAAEFVEARGDDALRVLRERAELAEELGHKVAARTWRRMLENAAALVDAAPSFPPALHPMTAEKHGALR